MFRPTAAFCAASFLLLPPIIELCSVTSRFRHQECIFFGPRSATYSARTNSRVSPAINSGRRLVGSWSDDMNRRGDGCVRLHFVVLLALSSCLGTTHTAFDRLLSPAEYDVAGVTYLTPADQEALPFRITNLLPWNHFGRKNIGYLYAVHHGAKVIYDVDDDNALTTPAEGVPHTDSAFAPASTRTFAVGPEATVHNPYGCFGGPANVWPRGFPLEAVNDNDSTRCDVVVVSERDGVEGKARPLGVVQALANHDPDVDAIYRLTYPPGGLPFSFEGSTAPPEGDSVLKAVPPAAFTPYNAQATLHFPPAFWGMLLPVTVHGRVSDIWRSYFTQALLPSTGAITVFAPAWVTQIRNPHNYRADFQAELPLYERSGALVAFLDEHRRQGERASLADVSLPERVEALAVTMYEYGIIGATDVELTQAWLEDLASIGYELGTPQGP